MKENSFLCVSVPIRELFNLTSNPMYRLGEIPDNYVSVPIRGLFNLTCKALQKAMQEVNHGRFRPHQGII